MLISLVSSMLLSRFRSLTEYGTYSQLLMAINLVCSALMLGLPNSLNYFIAKAESQEEKDKFLSVYYTLSTILSFFTGLVLVISTPLLEVIFDNSLIGKFWYFLALFPWTKIIMSSVENLLISFRKTGTMMLYRFLNSLALLGIIILVELFDGSFGIYMILYLAVEGIFTIWVYLLAKFNTEQFKPLLQKSIIKTLLVFSIPLGIASMVGTINVELDKFVIGLFFTTEEMAIYTNASKELPITIISSSLTAILLPQIVRLLKEEKKEEVVVLWGSAITLSFCIICFFAAGCFVFAPEVIRVLYSDKYLSGTEVFRVYCVVLLLRCTYFGMLLNANGKTKFIFYSSIGSLVLNLGLNFLFYYLFGFIGPAIATFVSTGIMQLLQLIYSSKIVKIKFKNIFPWGNMLKILVINGVLGIAFYFAHYYLGKVIEPIVSAILLGIIWGVCDIGLLLKMISKNWKVLNKER